MNTKIILRNIASYREGSNLETDKKINLVYGLNGTGKTILSNYLYGKSKENKPENWIDFQNCEDSFDEQTKILVYNEKFIEDIFYEKIPGIFTLSSKNKQAEENIKTAEAILKEESNKKDNLKNEIKTNQKNFDKTKENILNKIWNIKEKYTGGDRLLDYCLEGLKGKKEKLFKHLHGIPKPDNKPEETIEDLKSSLKSIKSGDIIQVIPKIENYDTEEDSPNKIENHQIFKEMIIGSKDSSVSDLIKKFNNSNWVKKGLEYLPEKIKESVECPFCQEKTITEKIASEIKEYFDESYQKKIDKILQMKEHYNKFIVQIDHFKSKNQENIFVKEKKHEFNNLVAQLKIVLNKNLKEIQNKIKTPNKEIFLKNSENQLNKLNQFIEDVNEKIQSHNTKIKNAKDEKERIKTIFWQTMRFEYDQSIEFYIEEDEKFNQTKKDLEDQIKRYEEKISKQENIIQDNQKRTVSLETAILNINQNLEDIGITDFKIEKQTNDESYFLTRDSSSNSNFKSLSEGEKTIISFLYFLELCQGRSNKQEISDKKVIIIDDPVSSLSHIYIFNIAQLIKNKFFNDQKNRYQKIFVLTHSLYFFHELVKYRQQAEEKEDQKKQTNLFRIVKNPSSQILKMSENEIKNDYEAYWEILKDYQSTKKPHPIMPNVMRNILEHFFGFIGKSNFADELNKLNDKKYLPFIRYMNRESHSNRENINDTNELDHSLFFKAFTEVFEQSGHKEHYEKMIGE